MDGWTLLLLPVPFLELAKRARTGQALGEPIASACKLGEVWGWWMTDSSVESQRARRRSIKAGRGRVTAALTGPTWQTRRAEGTDTQWHMQLPASSFASPSVRAHATTSDMC